jgi:thiol-disulfide isomerase/thioredoxin
MGNSNTIPFKDLKDSFEVYKNNYPKSEFISFFEEKYLINIKTIHYNSNDVALVNSKSENLPLKLFLNKHKGKLIYVDFWASWCAPCIEEIPSSHKLQDAYKDKNVVFLYISTDSDKIKWEKTNVKYGLVNGNSFLALNYPQADFYQELELKTIPRYVLYNKNGELVHKNAPRPSSKEIKMLFDTYLNE